ncbi:MAG: TolC family protein, partial [Terriglobales bacterium]
MKARSTWLAISALLGCLPLGSCAHYRPLPLPPAPDLAQTPALTAPAQSFLLPGLPAHLVPDGGLDELTVSTLAVFNNPDLKAARLEAGVAAAQLLSAWLLPDPELGIGVATSALNYGGSLSLDQDIHAILVRGAVKAGARAAQQQVNLAILWQEWQVAERARELFIQSCADDRLQPLLAQAQALWADRYGRDRAGMQRNTVTALVVAGDLANLADAQAGVRQLELDRSLARHELNQVLGLDPEVELHLIASTPAAPMGQGEFDSAVAALPHRRVDLLALQTGYESQEERVREAILSQFPALSAGVEPALDAVEGVNSIGLNVHLTLPLFNRNRGAIAVQEATRAVLRQKYQAQLDLAEGQAAQAWHAAL